MHKHPTPAEIQAAIVKAMIEMAVKENISTHTVGRMIKAVETGVKAANFHHDLTKEIAGYAS
jgi:hypothetical protein